MKAKSIFLPLSMLLIFLIPANADLPVTELVKFDRLTHDMGTIEQGVPQKVTFTLTNYADEPLILTRVKGSCGCTATEYSKDPIMPGEQTEIEATYNAKSLGAFSKTVTVQTNLQDEAIVLHIKGKVVQAS